MDSTAAESTAIERTLAYHAALGDILRTLGRAPFDLDAILDSILNHTVRLCHAERGFIYLRGEDGLFRHAAAIGASEAFIGFNLAHLITPRWLRR